MTTFIKMSIKMHNGNKNNPIKVLIWIIFIKLKCDSIDLSCSLIEKLKCMQTDLMRLRIVQICFAQ